MVLEVGREQIESIIANENTEIKRYRIEPF